MTAKEFDPVAFWNEKRDEFLGKGVMSRVSNDSTAADVLRAIAAEAAKQQAKKDADRCRATQTDGMSGRDGAYDQGCEDCAQAIEREAGL